MDDSKRSGKAISEDDCPRLWDEWQQAERDREWAREVEEANDAEPSGEEEEDE